MTKATYRHEALDSPVGPVLLAMATATLALLTPKAPSALTLSLIILTSLCLVIFFQMSRLPAPTIGIFSPSGFPLIYCTAILAAPLIYVGLTDKPVGSIPPDMLNYIVVRMTFFFVFGYTLGVGLGRAHKPHQCVRGRPDEKDTSGSITVIGGRILLALSVLASVYYIGTYGSVYSRLYGANQLAYDPQAGIAILAEVLVLPGALCVMAVNSSTQRTPLMLPDWILLIATMTLQVALLGNRAVLITPIVLYLWYRYKVGRPIRFVVGAALAVILVICMLSMGLIRYGQRVAFDDPLNTLMFEISSPDRISYYLSQFLRSEEDFYQGSTYVAALEALLPGFFRQYLGIQVTGTGTLAFRDLIGFTNEDQGFGFALTAEAYMNYGMAGIVVVSMLLGWLLQKTFHYVFDISFNWRQMIYPALVSSLPYTFRSDLLGFIKGVCYPLIILALMVSLERVVLRARGRSANSIKPQ